MDKSRTKFIVILLLAIINFALAGNLLYTRYAQSVIPQKTIDHTLAFLEQCGLWCEEKVIPHRAHTVYTQTIARNTKAEAAIAETLLGNIVKSEQGGGIDIYTGTHGEAVFRRGGLISIRLSGQAMPSDASEAAEAAKTLLKKADLLPSDYGLVVETGDSITVRFICEIDGVRLRNTDLSVTYADGTATISGCAFTGEFSRGSEASRQITAVLADFAAYAAAYQPEVSLIVAAENAYYHTVSDDGSVHLIPAIYIKTDGGDFLVSGLDGSVLSGI